METTDGHIGWGDVAPLPGFSRESIEEVEEDWSRHHSVLLRRPFRDFDVFDTERSPVVRFTTSSMRFGVEQALLHLEAQHKGVLLADVIAPGGPQSVRVTGLVTGTGSAAVTEAGRLVEHGYRSLKIKVGRAHIEEDTETIIGIRRTVGAGIQLRLDANRAWSFDDAVRVLADAYSADIEFIEEPLGNPELAGRLHDETGVPIALDETMLSISPGDLHNWAFATYLVLKPSLIGGIAATERLVAAAAPLGMIPVVSASYESGLAIGVLGCLAARWCPDGPSAGLDTYRRLSDDVLRRPLQIGPEMYLSDLSFDLKTGFDGQS